MSPTNIETDGEPVGDAMGPEEALALQGSGFDYTNEEIESFSCPESDGVVDRHP